MSAFRSEVERLPYPQVASYRIARGRDDRPVLILHGLGGDSSRLWNVIDRAELGFPTLLAPDARMHGDFNPDESSPVSFAHMVRDLLDLLAAIDLREPISIVGLSMGAGTALRMSILAPEMVRCLVLIRPAWQNSPVPSNLQAIKTAGECIRAEGVIAGRLTFMASEPYRELRTRFPQAAASALSQFDKPHAEERIARLLDIVQSVPYDSVHELQAIDAATLVVGFTGDALHPLGTARRIAQTIRGAEFSVIETSHQGAAGITVDAELRSLVTTFLGSYLLTESDCTDRSNASERKVEDAT